MADVNATNRQPSAVSADLQEATSMAVLSLAGLLIKGLKITDLSKLTEAAVRHAQTEMPGALAEAQANAQNQDSPRFEVPVWAQPQQRPALRVVDNAYDDSSRLAA